MAPHHKSLEAPRSQSDLNRTGTYPLTGYWYHEVYHFVSEHTLWNVSRKLKAINRKQSVPTFIGNMVVQQ